MDNGFGLWAQLGGAAGGGILTASPVRLGIACAVQLLLVAAGVGLNLCWLTGKRYAALNPVWLRTRLLRNQWPAAAVGGLVLLLLLNFMIAQTALYLAGSLLKGFSGVLVLTVLFHWSALAFAVFYMQSVRGSWGGVFGMRWKEAGRKFRAALVYYTAAVPWLLGGTLLYQWLLRLAGVEFSLQNVVELLMQCPSFPARLYLLFTAVVLAPLAEELLFRGLLFPLFIRWLNVPLAVFLTSLLFAALHFHAASFMTLFLISIAFSLAYWRTGSLWVPVGMHALFNAVNAALLLFISG